MRGGARLLRRALERSSVRHRGVHACELTCRVDLPFTHRSFLQRAVAHAAGRRHASAVPLAAFDDGFWQCFAFEFEHSSGE